MIELILAIVGGVIIFSAISFFMIVMYLGSQMKDMFDEVDFNMYNENRRNHE